MAGAQIRRFLVLHKELDADDGEVTRTQKVRRGFIAERYAPLIDALYDGSSRGRHCDRGHFRGRPQGRPFCAPENPGREHRSCGSRAGASRMSDGPSSCAGLTRASIFLVTKLLAKASLGEADGLPGQARY